VFAAGWTGGGILGLGATVSSSSSSRFTESIIPRMDDVEAAVVGRELLAAGGSFCGGAGGASGADGGDGAPRGPRGSSTTSRRVGWAPCCRLRGPRLAVERGAAEALGADVVFGLAEELGSIFC
jgi:hypothetical protein